MNQIPSASTDMPPTHTSPSPSRIMTTFNTLHSHGKKAFVPFTLLGWPDAETCLSTIQGMIQGGASMLELGMAFSDPIADGPVIEEAANEVLASGFRVQDGFALIQQVRAQHPSLPISLMTYYNLLLHRGMEPFVKEAKAAGVDGVLVVDLPPEASAPLADTCRRQGIDVIFIVSPLTDASRLSSVLQEASGYLYVVSRLGITGVNETYDTDLKQLLESIRQASDLPLCVGFGISTPEQAKKMASLGADGVITGSRITQLIQEQRGQKGTSETTAKNIVQGYVQGMVHALNP